ncbi:mRNA export factor Gle1 [Galleria mellonella]|uniref:mRNA export factor GLE1 n=1 Tax=Galleria mellonella TaxID=7137 RepID=A0A6J1WWN2_GALME|nr:mRNA export factor Gle1 [Galleria mellonella]
MDMEDYNIDTNSKNSSYKKTDLSISDQLADFKKLRISALTKAAEISPLIKEVTIGPNSPIKKQEVHVERPVINTVKKGENLIEDKIREDLRYTLIMKEYETKMQKTTEDSFRELIEKMIAKRAEVMGKYWKAQSEECERRALERRNRKLQMLKQQQENDNVSLLERAKLDEQNTQLVNKQTIENMNRILEEQNKATARFAAITDSHTKICICYSEISNLIQTEPLGKTVCDKYVSLIDTVLGNITILLELCKTGAITEKEVKQAEILSLNIDNVKTKIIEDLHEIKQQELVKKQKELEEEARKKKELEEKMTQEAKIKEAEAEITVIQDPSLQHTKKVKPTFYSCKNYSHYEELKTFLDEYEAQYKELLENVNLKKFRFDCQKAVNTPVNALSSVSGLHIKDKYEKLSKLLKGDRVQVLDTYVTATQHPQGLFYCTALLAKKIVQQGDRLVSSNPEAAFPLAAIAVALSSQFPIFGKLLEANFHKQCPYLVPMYLPQKEGQTDKEFYLSRGYTYNEDGVVEKQDKFLKRISGIFQLQCAIWIAKTPRFLNTPNPYSLKYGWCWLASFVNLKPEADISATLLNDFFTICGHEFFKHYGKQFTKVIKLVNTDYLTILQSIDEGGPKTRLEVFLQSVLKSGHIPPPNGVLQPNTW